MRILLDEDLDVRLRRHFRGDHQVETVQFRGWKGMKNGELLEVASADYDVLVTMDDNLPHQQDLGNFDLAVVICGGAGAPSSMVSRSGRGRFSPSRSVRSVRTLRVL